MRKLSIVAMVILGTVLVGCTTQGGEIPTSGVPTSVDSSQGVPTPVQSTPIVTADPSPTPDPRPTPMWTEEEQAAIDGLNRFFEVWTEIANDPQSADFAKLTEVSQPPLSESMETRFTRWRELGYFIVGGPEFTVDWVKPGALDDAGKRYWIHGCYSIEHGYLSEADGSRVDGRGQERSPGQYQVLHSKGRFYVVGEIVEDGEC